MCVPLFLCCALAALADDAAPGIEIPDAIALEQETLRARRRITCGEVEYHVVRKLDSGNIEQEFDYRIVFDGQRIRCDVSCQLHPPSDARGAAHTSVLRKCVFTEDALLRYIEVNGRAGSERVLHIREPNTPSPGQLPHDKIDPRLIGVVPADPLVLQSASLESFLAPPDRTNTSVERQELGDLGTWRVRYDRGDGARIRMWIAPSQEYSIVRAAEEFRYEQGSLLRTIECENREYGNPGVWFPSQVRYERFVNEKWYYGAALTVRRARFNQPVDERVFSLAGMEIPEGTPIMDARGSGGGEATWDGRNVVPLRGDSPLSDLDAERPERRVPWRLLLSPVALSMAGLLAAFVRWRQRFKKSRARG